MKNLLKIGIVASYLLKNKEIESKAIWLRSYFSVSKFKLSMVSQLAKQSLKGTITQILFVPLLKLRKWLF